MPFNSDAPGFQKSIRRFYPLLWQVGLISVVVGSLTLMPIFFNGAIYNHVIASSSLKSLPMLLAGVLMALTAEIVLRDLRNRKLGAFGARIDHFVSTATFERLMFLPPAFTERTSASAQLARLRDFESVRDFFTGPMAGLFFELPLIAVYLIVMVAMTGWLSLVPFALLLAYIVLILVSNTKLKYYSRLASNATTRRHEFLLETVTKLRAIRLAGLEKIWAERYRGFSAQASLASCRSTFAAQVFETVSYVLMMIGGIATLAFGVLAVIERNITTGALVAAMMLIWRIIAPMQIACASITRIQQLSSSSKQVQKLLETPPEHDPYAVSQPFPKLKGHIGFHRVTMRYSADTEPSLLGVSFDIQPGQVVAIKGNNGSGKSSLLKLILGLYQPQGGSVRLDGVDIRQQDPVLLRHSISYVPQTVDFFPGSIRDNLYFNNPLATEEICLKVLAEACALDEISHLPGGIDAIIEGEGAMKISFLLRQKINLARAYIKPSSIFLFDEASYSLGQENDAAFVAKIEALRGKATVVLVTHREDHMNLADKLFVINKGELTHAGPPDQVLAYLRGKQA